MSGRLQRDEALEKEDRIDEKKKQTKKQQKNNNNNKQPIPHLPQAQQAPILPYAKVVGRPGTGSYPAPSPDPNLNKSPVSFLIIFIVKMAIRRVLLAISTHVERYWKLSTETLWNDTQDAAVEL